LAGVVAGAAGQGDVIGLSGDLGAGKTTFARAFIHARDKAAGASMHEEVPSPTFTLVQIYPCGDVPVWHFDLFRINRPDDAIELGIDEAFSTAISLIEWPERLGSFYPRDRLDIHFEITGGGAARTARLTGHGSWAARLGRLDLDG
jgi:tRNA threonylcarbamoyladenosine biosynthesis protein TsaE